MKLRLPKHLLALRPSRNVLFGIAGGFLFLWVLLFDSHSLLQRMKWQHELNATRTHNETLEASIEEKKQEVRQGISDEVVERIARESYGMRKPGETVYQIKSDN